MRGEALRSIDAAYLLPAPPYADNPDADGSDTGIPDTAMVDPGASDAGLPDMAMADPGLPDMAIADPCAVREACPNDDEIRIAT